ncbi:hypothetical protein ADUPG1_013374 [Aduncisulcus paluster]|uniref:Uncharacterized protein n=1 Tax=Aduncisulcus paluster TaxID=2918883 RepID=A0ABQ5K2S7_9EUKA|nr:hypothetical protein ADUPG1_013374 [Aduncisulcus paluster]
MVDLKGLLRQFVSEYGQTKDGVFVPSPDIIVNSQMFTELIGTENPDKRTHSRLLIEWKTVELSFIPAYLVCDDLEVRYRILNILLTMSLPLEERGSKDKTVIPEIVQCEIMLRHQLTCEKFLRQLIFDGIYCMRMYDHATIELDSIEDARAQKEAEKALLEEEGEELEKVNEEEEEAEWIASQDIKDDPSTKSSNIISPLKQSDEDLNDSQRITGLKESTADPQEEEEDEEDEEDGETADKSIDDQNSDEKAEDKAEEQQQDGGDEKDEESNGNDGSDSGEDEKEQKIHDEHTLNEENALLNRELASRYFTTIVIFLRNLVLLPDSLSSRSSCGSLFTIMLNCRLHTFLALLATHSHVIVPAVPREFFISVLTACLVQNVDPFLCALAVDEEKRVKEMFQKNRLQGGLSLTSIVPSSKQSDSLVSIYRSAKNINTSTDSPLFDSSDGVSDDRSTFLLPLRPSLINQPVDMRIFTDDLRERIAQKVHQKAKKDAAEMKKRRREEKKRRRRERAAQKTKQTKNDEEEIEDDEEWLRRMEEEEEEYRRQEEQQRLHDAQQDAELAALLMDYDGEDVHVDAPIAPVAPGSAGNNNKTNGVNNNSNNSTYIDSILDVDGKKVQAQRDAIHQQELVRLGIRRKPDMTALGVTIDVEGSSKVNLPSPSVPLTVGSRGPGRKLRNMLKPIPCTALWSAKVLYIRLIQSGFVSFISEMCQQYISTQHENRDEIASNMLKICAFFMNFVANLTEIAHKRVEIKESLKSPEEKAAEKQVLEEERAKKKAEKEEARKAKEEARMKKREERRQRILSGDEDAWEEEELEDDESESESESSDLEDLKPIPEQFSVLIPLFPNLFNIIDGNLFVFALESLHKTRKECLNFITASISLSHALCLIRKEEGFGMFLSYIFRSDSGKQFNKVLFESLKEWKVSKPDDLSFTSSLIAIVRCIFLVSQLNNSLEVRKKSTLDHELDNGLTERQVKMLRRNGWAVGDGARVWREYQRRRAEKELSGFIVDDEGEKKKKRAERKEAERKKKKEEEEKAEREKVAREKVEQRLGTTQTQEEEEEEEKETKEGREREGREKKAEERDQEQKGEEQEGEEQKGEEQKGEEQEEEMDGSESELVKLDMDHIEGKEEEDAPDPLLDIQDKGEVDKNAGNEEKKEDVEEEKENNNNDDNDDNDLFTMGEKVLGEKSDEDDSFDNALKNTLAPQPDHNADNELVDQDDSDIIQSIAAARFKNRQKRAKASSGQEVQDMRMTLMEELEAEERALMLHRLIKTRKQENEEDDKVVHLTKWHFINGFTTRLVQRNILFCLDALLEKKELQLPTSVAFGQTLLLLRCIGESVSMWNFPTFVIFAKALHYLPSKSFLSGCVRVCVQDFTHAIVQCPSLLAWTIVNAAEAAEQEIREMEIEVGGRGWEEEELKRRVQDEQAAARSRELLDDENAGKEPWWIQMEEEYNQKEKERRMLEEGGEKGEKEKEPEEKKKENEEEDEEDDLFSSHVLKGSIPSEANDMTTLDNKDMDEGSLSQDKQASPKRDQESDKGQDKGEESEEDDMFDRLDEAKAQESHQGDDIEVLKDGNEKNTSGVVINDSLGLLDGFDEGFEDL